MGDVCPKPSSCSDDVRRTELGYTQWTHGSARGYVPGSIEVGNGDMEPVVSGIVDQHRNGCYSLDAGSLSRVPQRTVEHDRSRVSVHPSSRHAGTPRVWTELPVAPTDIFIKFKK